MKPKPQEVTTIGTAACYHAGMQMHLGMRYRATANPQQRELNEASDWLLANFLPKKQLRQIFPVSKKLWEFP